VTREAGDAESLKRIMKEQACDVLILDIGLPGKSGLDILEDICKTYPEVKVVILTTYPEKRFAHRAFKSGALGYVTKDASADEVVMAVRKVAQGKKYISANFAAELADEFGREKTQAPHEKLSRREHEVMQYLLKGRSIKEIAHEMKISQSTVSTYQTRILQKLNITSILELAQYAIDHGLMP
jgi:DNA-binding NarL/FixJ family response regulator